MIKLKAGDKVWLAYKMDMVDDSAIIRSCPIIKIGRGIYPYGTLDYDIFCMDEVLGYAEG